MIRIPRMQKKGVKERGTGSRLASHNPLLISPREAEEAFSPASTGREPPKLSFANLELWNSDLTFLEYCLVTEI